MGGKERFVVFLNIAKKVADHSTFSLTTNKDKMMNFQMGDDRSVNYSTSSS